MQGKGFVGLKHILFRACWDCFGHLRFFELELMWWQCRDFKKKCRFYLHFPKKTWTWTPCYPLSREERWKKVTRKSSFFSSWSWAGKQRELFCFNLSTVGVPLKARFFAASHLWQLQVIEWKDTLLISLHCFAHFWHLTPQISALYIALAHPTPQDPELHEQTLQAVPAAQTPAKSSTCPPPCVFYLSPFPVRFRRRREFFHKMAQALPPFHWLCRLAAWFLSVPARQGQGL